MNDDFGIQRFANIEFELSELKANRRIREVLKGESSSIEILVGLLDSVERLLKKVRADAGQSALLEGDIEEGKKLWSALWSFLVVPSLKKIQDDIADLLKRTLQRASDLLTLNSTDDRTVVDITSKPFATQDTAARLAVQALRSSLRQAHARSSKEPRGRLRLPFPNDFTHLKLAVGVFALLSLMLFLTRTQLPSAITMTARLVSWYIVLLWFPVYFLDAIPVRTYQLTTIIWATFFLWLAYGFLPGTLYALLLFAIPISKLLRTPAFGSLDPNTTSYSLAAAAGILAVFVLSHEPMWLFGLAMWVAFILILSVSREYYRKLDQVEAVANQPPSRQLRHRVLLFGYLFTLVLFSPGISAVALGRGQSSLLILLTTLLVTFITLVFAIQAIVPGITAWESDNTRAGLREQKTLLQTIESLRGFLISGCIALGAMVLLQILPIDTAEYSFAADRYFQRVSHILDALFTGGAGKVSVSFTVGMMSQLALIFAVAVSIQVLSQLYYLFIAANTLLIPLRAKVRSVPPILPTRAESCPAYHTDTEKQAWEKVTASLEHWEGMRGMVVTNLRVNASAELGDSLRVLIEFWDDFPDRSRICEFAYSLCSLLFQQDPRIDAVRIVFRTTLPKYGEVRAFLAELGREDWHVIFQGSRGNLPVEYVWKELGADFHNGVFEDAYAA